VREPHRRTLPFAVVITFDLDLFVFLFQQYIRQWHDILTSGIIWILEYQVHPDAFLVWISETIKSFEIQRSAGLPVTIKNYEALLILGGFFVLSDVFQNTKKGKLRPWVRWYSRVWEQDVFFHVIREQIHDSFVVSPDYSARLLRLLKERWILLTRTEEV
jgi:hypothetical protein